MAAWVEPAPAKVNLALHVRARRPDGFHELETLFAFTRFGDRLEAWPHADWGLEVVGETAAQAGPVEDNLVLRAARAFAAATGLRQRFRFRLHKRIPVAAGLGGGSADAAAALRLLDRAAGTRLGLHALAEIAGELGADVPACVHARTLVGRGRGERLAPGPDVTGLPVVLVNPGVPMPTGPVFRAWDGLDRGPLPADWRVGRNDLEAPAIALAPVVGQVLAFLSALPGAGPVRMSGSGATCLAVGVRALPPLPRGWWGVATELL
ncbi:MAG: 4-(cytidine 5'-diphospho)-2-C-methyl-D-erythritol kinase [Sphingomonadaceae bacterium]|uniref:4-(cytidine 5'-diphospho)-2-C-methyl-D-erythritol kinase n=1 Tax=Thermaurantiacus sp. TaxID=2820283 RepID=UPI00298EE300|nr:4-(cytidine 5'-diphospho)-2-C-methyl-D-erythritol kinase [Thermaurantiacus sp.]MCS6986385.1 4-(cytidine 5'-diphospho)-2-C-methyl-D-erythritol kinase [Sphingomonadaceae bacterium]MDW8414353.1 4-(cytidine 5'-diphospho)-2-C-methyl-D-erythritol kinase [Thermaurantiacus sp.]